MTPRFLEVLQLFFKLSSSHVRPVAFSRASVPSWPRRDITLRRGSRGGRRDGVGASWKDPPRMCWIKSLHLDLIVLPLRWVLPLPRGDRIIGCKTATCQDIRPHLESYFTTTERFLRIAGSWSLCFRATLRQWAENQAAAAADSAAVCNGSSKC